MATELRADDDEGASELAETRRNGRDSYAATLRVGQGWKKLHLGVDRSGVIVAQVPTNLASPRGFNTLRKPAIVGRPTSPVNCDWLPDGLTG